MKKRLLFSLAFFSSLFAEEATDSNMSRVSEAFGHIIYKNFECLNVKFDIEKILQGIESAAAGKESPLPEKECIDAIHSEQEKRLKILSKENLQKAEIFLASNAKKEGVVSLEEGKVQYRVVSAGKGAEVKLHSAPLVRFTVKTMNGVDLWDPNLEESVSLDETVAGMRAGLLGMKEGEKRILYIHPDLSFEHKELFLHIPNELLSFEIEVLQVDS